MWYGKVGHVEISDAGLYIAGARSILHPPNPPGSNPVNPPVHVPMRLPIGGDTPPNCAHPPAPMISRPYRSKSVFLFIGQNGRKMPGHVVFPASAPRNEV